jgi:hypothetical protein
VRAFNERAAINARLQGTAADIIRHAMVRMDAALQKEKLSARMLLQVHDELVFEVPDDQVEKTLPVVKKVMEEAPMPALSLSVPLRVDARAANNWDERIAPVAAGRVAARGREMALRVRARQHVMRVDGIAAARDWLALLGQRRLLGDIVGVGVKVLDALGYHHTLCVLPRTFADAVARTHSRFAARLCRAEISPPIGVARSCRPGERLAMRVGALDTAEVGAIALTHAGYEERYACLLRLDGGREASQQHRSTEWNSNPDNHGDPHTLFDLPLRPRVGPTLGIIAQLVSACRAP